MWLMWLAMALAEPLTVVAVGDAPVASAALAPETVTVQPGGWVSVVGDCLEESHPGHAVVVDRTQAGDTALAVQQRIDDLRLLQPDVVVVSLGGSDVAAEPSAHDAFVTSLGATLDMMGPAELHRLVLGIVPGEQALPIGPWNAALRTVVEQRANATFVDLRPLWPSDPDKVRTMLHTDGSLSSRGHATVGATVCAAVQTALHQAVSEQALQADPPASTDEPEAPGPVSE